jgi:hypothetical protein
MPRHVLLLLVAAAPLGCNKVAPDACVEGAYPGYYCACPDGLQACKVFPGVAYCSDLRNSVNCGLCQRGCGHGMCSGSTCICDASPLVSLCPVPVTNIFNIEMSYTGIVAGTCVDTSSDPRACGGCLRDCGVGTCVAGRCECPSGSTACSGYPACVFGTCTCAPGETLCAGSLCTDVTTPSSCFPCSPDQVRCPSGVCADPLKPPPSTCFACPAGLVDCTWGSPKRCVDLATDSGSCGACDVVCPAGRRCVSGVCT